MRRFALWSSALFACTIHLTFAASADYDLCKRRPYLIFCQNQDKQFVESRVEVPDPEPLATLPPVVHPKAPLRFRAADDAGAAKPVTPPIDLSRPNAEDVAREMGELQRDDPVDTNRIPDAFEPVAITQTPLNTAPFSDSQSRRKRNDDASPLSDTTDTPPTHDASLSKPLSPEDKEAIKFNSKRLQDWVYLDDTDNLDYLAYRRRRARLLRRLNDLDNDQIMHRYHDRRFAAPTSDYYQSGYAYPSYGPSYASHYPSSYYSNGYAPYGYPSYYGSGYPGGLGGYGGNYGGWGRPFTFGIGSGLNIGLPDGGGVGVGSGLGVTVG